MKKILSLVLITLIVICTTACGNKVYPRTMIVTEFDEETDMVILTDFVGYEWVFYGIEDWAIGDVCSCIMDDNGTESIGDDRIIETRYNGNIGGGDSK